MLGGILAYLGVILLIAWVASDPEAPPWVEGSMGILYLLVLLLLIVDDIGVTLRRLEDLGRPRSHFWLLLIPVYNIYLGLVLLFQPGTDQMPEENEPSRGSVGVSEMRNPSTEFVCSRCGRDIKWGDPFCPGCGDTIEY